MQIFGGRSPSSESRDAIGADQDGYPGILGYQGPALSEVAGSTVAPLAPFIENMMMRKSENEIALIRESARWGASTPTVSCRSSRGRVLTEAEASLRAGQEATLAMLQTLGDSYGGQQAPRRRLGRLPRPDRAAQLLGTRGRP